MARHDPVEHSHVCSLGAARIVAHAALRIREFRDHPAYRSICERGYRDGTGCSPQLYPYYVRRSAEMKRIICILVNVAGLAVAVLVVVAAGLHYEDQKMALPRSHPVARLRPV